MAIELSIKHALTKFNSSAEDCSARRPILRRAVNRFSLCLLAASMTALVGCGGSLSGGKSSASSSSPEQTAGFAQCANPEGLAPQDLAGQCRGTSLTMGALEIDTGVATATSAQAGATSLTATNSASGAVRIAWQPIGNSAAGYMVYYGKTAETASVLLSDLPAGAIDPAAPSVTYDAARDLGMVAGDAACFRIFAYDATRALSSESTVVCATA